MLRSFNCLSTKSNKIEKHMAELFPQITNIHKFCFGISCNKCPGNVFGSSSVMYLCSGQHHSGVIQLAELLHIIHLERGSNPSYLHRPGGKSWVTHVKGSELFIVTYLSFREGSPRGASVWIHLKLGWSGSFRGEWERIMCDQTANRGFNWGMWCWNSPLQL